MKEQQEKQIDQFEVFVRIKRLKISQGIIAKRLKRSQGAISQALNGNNITLLTRIDRYVCWLERRKQNKNSNITLVA